MLNKVKKTSLTKSHQFPSALAGGKLPTLSNVEGNVTLSEVEGGVEGNVTLSEVEGTFTTEKSQNEENPTNHEPKQ
jgi:hypothetical protein